ncbi:MAG TPA: hypothetical protein VGE01_04595, partial [Fimbriimonas sp.]
AGAFGLAAREALGVAQSVPRIDLFFQERSSMQLEEKTRNVRGSLVVSALALVFGVVGWYLFSTEAGKVEGEVTRIKEQVAALDQEAIRTAEERQKRLSQYKALRGEGLPIGVMMDYICASMLPGIGLENVEIRSDKHFTIRAEATEEPTMISTAANLQRSPVLQGVQVESYQMAGKTKASGIKFTIGGSTVGSERIRYAHEKKEDRS